MEKPIKLKTRKRFSALDVKAETAALNKILSGCKVNTVYDLCPKTFLIKLGRVNKRVNLFLESGIRFHTITDFQETKDKPNSFTTRLRKAIKGLYFKEAVQIGVERVARITFCGADTEDKERTFHIFMELYAKGNIIFTDSDLKVICCLRKYAYSEEKKIDVGEIYPVELAAKYRFDDIKIDLEEFEGIVAKSKKRPNNTQVMSRLVPCGHQSFIESWLLAAGLAPNGKVKETDGPLLVSTAKGLLDVYKEDFILKGAYTYKKEGALYPFEFSPFKLDFVG